MMGVVAEVSHDSTRFITPLAAFGVDDYNEPDDEDEDDRRRMQHEFETTDDFEPTVPFMWTTEEWDPRPLINDSSNSGMQVTGILVWPHFTVEHKIAQLNDTAVIVLELEADDVFGNGASTMFDVDNATAWNVTVGTTTWIPMSTTEMPETSEEMSSTEDLPSTSEMISTTQEDDGKTVDKLTRGLDNVRDMCGSFCWGCSSWWRWDSHSDGIDPSKRWMICSLGDKEMKLENRRMSR